MRHASRGEGGGEGVTTRRNSSWAIVYFAIIFAWLWGVSAVCAALPAWHRTVWGVAISPLALILIWRARNHRTAADFEGRRIHRGYNLIAAALLLTCAAATALWTGSYIFPIMPKPPAAAFTATPGTAFKGGMSMVRGSIGYVTWYLVGDV